MLLFLCGVCGIAVLGVQSMMTLHRDMNTKQSYMLFMTPKSCYAILGAKLMEGVLSILIAAGLCAGVAWLDAGLISQHFSQVQEITEFLRQIAQMVRVNMDLMSIVNFCTNLLFSWIFMLTTAYFADVLVSSVFRGKKMGGLLAFVLFLVLNVLLNRAIEAVPVSGDTTTQLLVNSGLCVAASVVMYIATARIMETKLSV